MLSPNVPALKAASIIEIFAVALAPDARKVEVGEAQMLMQGVGGLSRLVQVRGEQGKLLEERKFSPYQRASRKIVDHDTLNRQLQEAFWELSEKYSDSNPRHFTYYGSETLERLTGNEVKTSKPYAARHVPILFDTVKSLSLASTVWWPDKSKQNDYRVYINTDASAEPAGPNTFQIFGVGQGNPDRNDWLDYHLVTGMACDAFDQQYARGAPVKEAYDTAHAVSEQKIQGLNYLYR